MVKTPSYTTQQGILRDHDRTWLSFDGVICHRKKDRRLVIHLAERIPRCEICRELGIMEIRREG